MASRDLNELVKAMARCIHTCEQCVATCLYEKENQLNKACIAASLDCADICSLTLKLISRESSYWDHLLQLCVRTCQDCAKECSKHTYAACQECAEGCRYCLAACEQYMTVEMN